MVRSVWESSLKSTSALREPVSTVPRADCCRCHRQCKEDPNLVTAFSSCGGTDRSAATCYHSSVDSCPIVRENLVLCNLWFPSEHALGRYFCNSQCAFEVMTWKFEGTNQLLKQLGSRVCVRNHAPHTRNSSQCTSCPLMCSSHTCLNLCTCTERYFVW